jgi:GNAT superfamily N-acetyltransferase
MSTSPPRPMRPVSHLEHLPPSRAAATRRAERPHVELAALAPSHAPALERYFNALSDEARTFRFLGPTPHVPLAWARVFCRTDGERHLGWAAVRGEVVVGECQLAGGAGDGSRAEFALSVADGYRGQGIGRLLLATLAGAAARRGIEVLGFVADARNTTMLAWMASRGARWATQGGVVTGWLRTADAHAEAEAPRASRAA